MTDLKKISSFTPPTTTPSHDQELRQCFGKSQHFRCSDRSMPDARYPDLASFRLALSSAPHIRRLFIKIAKDQIAELLKKIVSLLLPIPFPVFRNEEEKCFATNFVRCSLPFPKEQWNSIIPI